MSSLNKALIFLLMVTTLSACISDSGNKSDSDSAATAADSVANTRSSEAQPEPSGMLPVKHGGLERNDINGTVVSDDGTVIHYSVFLPDLEPNEAAPVIVHSHGYGGSRLTSLSPAEGDGKFIGDAPAEAAFLARENGAIVVSYDQRGFGDSGGRVQLMDPEKEGRDFINVLDRITREFDDFILRSAPDGDPRVGTLGLSYGGGYQWMAGSIDERVDAMTPVATWYDLRFSLQPSDTPKNLWLFLLQAIGIPGSEGDQSDAIYTNFIRTLIPGVDTEEAFARALTQHSLRAYCEGFNANAGGVPTADALIIQGAADTLFNMNESVDAFECMRDAGRKAHLIVQRLGHIAPVAEQTPGPSGFATERFLQCGDRRYETSHLIHEFLDSSLRGQSSELSLPDTCMTIEGREGITGEAIVRGGDLFTPQDRILQPADATELLDPPELDDSGNLPADYLERVSPSMSIQLFTAEHDLNLAGIPEISLDVETVSPAEPTLFMGLEVSGKNEEGSTLIHNQVVPVVGKGTVNQALAGATFPLEAGDQVSLVVYTAHPLFVNHDGEAQSIANAITLSNMMVRLPLLD